MLLLVIPPEYPTSTKSMHTKNLGATELVQQIKAPAINAEGLFYSQDLHGEAENLFFKVVSLISIGTRHA